MSSALRVYIVEDSPIIQRLLGSAIEEAGGEVSGCSDDVQQAIADVFALQPDLIVIDIALPAGTGFDVLKSLHEHDLAAGVTKIVLTNHANEECEALARRLGADRFFDKSLESAQALAFIAAKAAERRGRGAAHVDSSEPSLP
ncbi:MAG TPA: response regulator [Casimicrobiaceae bacterium]|nr:response regulator [Casimicrobiaceae bacterium]